MKSYADDLERIEREHKQKMKKSEAAFARHYNDVSSQLRSQQVRSHNIAFFLWSVFFTCCTFTKYYYPEVTVVFAHFICPGQVS